MFLLPVGMLNVDGVGGKEGLICDKLRIMGDMCSLQVR